MKKVSLVKCKEYDYELVKASLLETIKNLGGLEKYILNGDRVLLKVNLLMKKKPEEATTTHPIFVKALADILSDYGALVIIGDSPGGPFNERMLKGIYATCGYNEIENGETIFLNKNYENFEDKNEKGKILKTITAIDLLNHVDKVISVSKLKTHGMMKFTGAVKNMFGIIPGILKAEYHFRMPEIKDFSQMLVDVCLYANPVLSFMDGIVGMEGAGPSGGEPVSIGIVIGSDSPYHLDYVATEMVGILPKSVPTIERTMERGIVLENGDDIEIIGENLKSCYYKNFKAPKINSANFLSNNSPKIIRKVADGIFKPRPLFDHNICIGCGDCRDACPPQVITMKENRPVVNLNGCIRCFCCQELCPTKAVTIKRPIFMKMIARR